MPPKYITPGSRSPAEGSGVTGSFPVLKPGAGQLTPPGLVSFPKGAASVEYSNGATMPATAASTVVMSSTALTYGKG